MSCLDVMYHQSYGGGAHCLPASQAAAAAAYKAAYYHHQQQQRKLSVYSKMQECVDHQQQQQHGPGGLRQHQQRGGGGGVLPGEPVGLRRAAEPPGSQSGGGRASTKDGSQPAEAEYLSSRCVLFTYFQGDIGDVVDQHFSRALSQSSIGAFGGGESKPFRASQSHASSSAAATGLWKDGVSLSENQSGSLSSSVWNSAYHQSQSSPPCLPSVSLSVHPDFSPSPVPFHPADGALWAGHALSQAGPPSLPDTWTYSLNAPQGTAGAYPHVHHDAYPRTHPRAHVHAARHAHAMLHSYPAHHGHSLDPRFSPLLLPAGVRGQQQSQLPAPCSPGSLHGSPHSEGIKTEMDPGGSSPVGATSTAWPPVALHGPPEGYETAVDQDKAKSTAWF